MQNQTQAAAQKTALRKKLRAARRALDENSQQTSALGVCEQLSALPCVQDAKTIAVYLCNDGEIDAAPFIAWCQKLSKTVLLPIMREKNTLLFAPFDSDTTFTKKDFGILEPSVPEERFIRPEQLDVVCMPLVGFDVTGNRLGMGGGFYDRSFAFLQEQGVKKPVLIGLAHECQKVDAIDVERFDIPVSAVVTDKAVYNFS